MRSQAVWANPDLYLGMHEVLHVTTRTGRVGKSSFETLVEMHTMPHTPERPGQLAVLCVCVMVGIGENGRSTPLGPKAAALATPSLSPLHALVDDSRSLRQTLDAATLANPAAFRMRQDVRYSDEDTNLHVNHANYLRFFDDAVVTVLDGADDDSDRATDDDEAARSNRAPNSSSSSAAAAPKPVELARRLQVPAAAVVIEYAREAAVRTSPFEVLLEASPAKAPASVDGYLVKDGTIYCRVRYYDTLPTTPTPTPAPAQAQGQAKL